MIETERLEFHYGGGDGASTFDGLDAVFQPGVCTALIGQSGSGKSTLLYLLGLMLRPTGGDVIVNGLRTAHLPDWQRANVRAMEMGFVFQDAILDPARSVIDNVLEGALYTPIPRDVARARAMDLLDRFGVAVNPLRRPGQISGGQAQRVALCRALLQAPDILLADEPSGNLDEASADLVWNALASAASEGATVVVATHDRKRAETCDRSIEVDCAAAS